MGPHPSEDRDVFHWFEMCDAVQAETYKVDGVEVSNFVLPLYFTGTRDTDEVGARNDFLGRVYKKQTLRSFGINPGGYIGFFDPVKNVHDTFSIRGDKNASKRLLLKAQAKQTRRSARYRDFTGRNATRLPAAGEQVAAAFRRSPVAIAAGSKSTNVRSYCSIPAQSSQPQAVPSAETTGTGTGGKKPKRGGSSRAARRKK
jgi:hypothetical protein